jgi:hypothetical protein
LSIEFTILKIKESAKTNIKIVKKAFMLLFLAWFMIGFKIIKTKPSKLVMKKRWS